MLERMMERYYYKKHPLMAFGGYGIGKSETFLNKSRDIAEQKDKEHFRWDKLTKEEKQELINDPHGKFVYIDTRVADSDPTDFKGLPNLQEFEAVEWKPPLWIYFMAKEGADGILFLDEANLGTPAVQSALQKLVNQRSSGSHALSEEFGIMAAGNRLEDHSNVYELSQALKDRYGEVELKPPVVSRKNAYDWTDWALDNGIDSRVLGFLQYKNSYLYKPRNDAKNKSATPRGWERASDIIEEVDSDEIQFIENLVASSVGTGVAAEFVEFMRLRDQISIEKIMNNPEKVELPDCKEETGKAYSVVSGVAERYKNNETKENLKKAMIISDRLIPEFGILLMRMVKNQDVMFFKQNIKQIEKWRDLSPKYEKYLIN